MKISIEVEVIFLSEELRAAKFRLRKTYRAIAKESNMTPQGVSRILNEENKVTPFKTLLALEPSLKVSISDLVKDAVVKKMQFLNILEN